MVKAFPNCSISTSNPLIPFSKLALTDFITAAIDVEEFLAILTNTNKKGALFVAEKIREQIEELNIDHIKSDVSKFVTLSLGVSNIKVDKIDNVASLIKKADDNLYNAKKIGRNKVVG